MENTSIIHFNDIYNCDKAPKFVSQLKESWKELESANKHVYTIFSGDGFSPSITSTIVRGNQMIPILNALKIDCACLGNHDLDFGLDEFYALREKCNFPWLCSNAKLVSTNEPLGGCDEYCILQKEGGGPKILVVGLIEAEWMETLATIDPSDIEFEEFDAYCQRRIPEIIASEGPFDIIVAATHMRMPNDYKLAETCGSQFIDIVLGGHDHHYEDTVKDNVHVLNSGTDFAEYTIIDVHGRKGEGTAGGTKLPLDVVTKRMTVSKDIAGDPDILDAIKEVQALVEQSMKKKIGSTKLPLDARFSAIRTQETNISNFVASLMTRATDADIAILNAGTIRADRIIPKGELLVKDICDLFPMADEIAVVELTAERLLLALENGVSKYPAMEGRFPCVDGVRFQFDPSKPPGSRILPGSVFVKTRPSEQCKRFSVLRHRGDAKVQDSDSDEDEAKEEKPSTTNTEIPVGFSPLDMNKTYSVVSKAYLISGKDGYESAFVGAPVIKDAELCPVLPTILRNIFTEIMILKRWKGIMGTDTTVIKAANVFKSSVRDSVVDPYAIRPIVDGRITNILEKKEQE